MRTYNLRRKKNARSINMKKMFGKKLAFLLAAGLLVAGTLTACAGGSGGGDESSGGADFSAEDGVLIQYGSESDDAMLIFFEDADDDKCTFELREKGGGKAASDGWSISKGTYTGDPISGIDLLLTFIIGPRTGVPIKVTFSNGACTITISEKTTSEKNYTLKPTGGPVTIWLNDSDEDVNEYIYFYSNGVYKGILMSKESGFSMVIPGTYTGDTTKDGTIVADLLGMREIKMTISGDTMVDEDGSSYKRIR